MHACPKSRVVVIAFRLLSCHKSGCCFVLFYCFNMYSIAYYAVWVFITVECRTVTCNCYCQRNWTLLGSCLIDNNTMSHFFLYYYKILKENNDLILECRNVSIYNQKGCWLSDNLPYNLGVFHSEILVCVSNHYTTE